MLVFLVHFMVHDRAIFKLPLMHIHIYTFYLYCTFLYICYILVCTFVQCIHSHYTALLGVAIT